MKYELWHHKLAYVILILGLVSATILFLATWPNHFLQRIVVLGASVSYLLWGVTLHLVTKRITRKIILEYVTVAALGGLMLLAITF